MDLLQIAVAVAVHVAGKEKAFDRRPIEMEWRIPDGERGGGVSL